MCLIFIFLDQYFANILILILIHRVYGLSIVIIRYLQYTNQKLNHATDQKKTHHILIDVKFRLILIEIIFNLKIQTILDFFDVKKIEIFGRFR